MPKSYKNPFDGYGERVTKYHQMKNSVPKPPSGKPRINPNSKILLNGNLGYEDNVWERLKNYQNRSKASKSSIDLIYLMRTVEETPTFKPNINKKLPKFLKRHNSENNIDAYSRLYGKAVEHHKYIDKISKEISKECTYSPLINDKSK